MANKDKITHLFHSNFYGEALSNLGLRALSLAGRFLLTFQMAKLLPISSLGQYGIWSVTITLSVYLLGLDFYAFSNREIVTVSWRGKIKILKSQFIFHLISSFFMMPFLGLIFYFRILPLEYIFYFFSILFFEHISQELYRIYVSFYKPVIANVVFFFRSGFWCYLILFLWHFDFIDKSLTGVFQFWFYSILISVLVGILFAKKVFLKVIKAQMDWAWIKAGLKISAPFFMATIAYKIVEFSDRYMLEAYRNIDEVGVYTFYATIANLVEIVVQTTVVIIYIPQIISSYNGEKQIFHKTFLHFKWLIVAVSFLVAVPLLAAIKPIIFYTEKPEFNNDLTAFYILVFSKMMFNFSLIYNYVLYAAKNDKAIFKASLFGAILNVILNVILIPSYGVSGAALSTLLSYIVIFVAKWMMAKSVLNKINPQ